MAKVVQAPPKFNHQEWNISNQTKYANAEAERIAAERLVAESNRLIEETSKRTVKTQRDVNKKFDQRIFDIEYWKKELDNKLDALKIETDNLVTFKTRIEKAIESCKEPLHIAQQCLANRIRRRKIKNFQVQHRKGIDLVHDDVEKELLCEIQTIQGVLALLERTLEQAVEQIRLNRKATYQLEKDLKDKFSALDIDKHNAELRNNSAGLHYIEGVAKIDANSVTPDDWEGYSNVNILNADKQLNNSINLRSMIDGVLQATANDMMKQKERVDVAFNVRIAETRDAKEKLEGHLAKVISQIKEMEENIDQLQLSIDNKEMPMKLTVTRLENRSVRPNVELCRDSVQYRLVEEVTEIETSVASLQKRLAQAKASLKGLLRRQLDLEDDIQIKANTLFIDETQCMGMRKSINIQTF